MCHVLVSFADFEAILMPFSEVIRNRHKRQVYNTFEVGELYFKLDSYLHRFFTIGDFPIQFSIYTQAVPYTRVSSLLY